MDLQYFGGGGALTKQKSRSAGNGFTIFQWGEGKGCHHFGSEQVFQPVQIS